MVLGGLDQESHAFFDGVGLLVPSYMRGWPEIKDPALVAGLKEHGLLHVLEPEPVVDSGWPWR